MRTKEVEEALKTLTQYTFVGGKVTQCEACECIDIAINYIKKLEEENTNAKEYADDVWRKQEELRVELEEQYINKQVIRDKIKDIEKQIKSEKAKEYTIPECFLILHTLEGILGE